MSRQESGDARNKRSGQQPLNIIQGLLKRIRDKYMKISVICVGKVKENFYREAIAEYAKGFPDTVNWKYWKWKMKRRPTGRVML